MKQSLIIASFAIFSFNLNSQCTLGFDSPLGEESVHASNYLLGSAINVSSSFSLTNLGMIAISPGVNFKVGVYNSVGGNPGTLLTQGSGTTVTGVNVINVPDVVLAPGTYFYMAVFETVANISYTTSTSDIVWYISLPYSSALPTSFGTPITYPGQAFSYYFIGNASIMGIDTQTACGPYTWINGTTYTSNNNTATYTYPAGAINGCDSTVTLNLTVNQPSSGIDTHTACGSYTWINGTTYTSNNNTATYTILGGSANGCDSIVTLNLTINNLPNAATSVNGITISATNAAATYAWMDCNNGNTLIANATNQSFTPVANGSYAVQVTQNGCVDTSACITISSVGIGENVAGLNAVLYPNPTSGDFSIELGEINDVITLTIHDLSGKILETLTYENTHKLNHTLHATPGVYVVSIESADSKANFRMIVE